MKKFDISWVVVILASGYLAFTIGREAIKEWPMWFLVIAFILVAIGGFVKMIKGEKR